MISKCTENKMEEFLFVLVLVLVFSTIESGRYGHTARSPVCTVNGVKGIVLASRRCSFDRAIKVDSSSCNPGQVCCQCSSEGLENDPCEGKNGDTGFCKPSTNCPDEIKGSCSENLKCCTQCTIGTGDLCSNADSVYGTCSCSCGENKMEITSSNCTAGLVCCKSSGFVGDPCEGENGKTGFCQSSDICPDAIQGSCNDNSKCCTQCPTGDLCNNADSVYGTCSCSCGENTMEVISGNCTEGLVCCKAIEPRYVLLGFANGENVRQMRERCNAIGRGLPLPQNSQDVDELLALATQNPNSGATLFMTGLVGGSTQNGLYPNSTEYSATDVSISIVNNVEAHIIETGGNPTLTSLIFPNIPFQTFQGMNIICEKF